MTVGQSSRTAPDLQVRPGRDVDVPRGRRRPPHTKLQVLSKFIRDRTLGWAGGRNPPVLRLRRWAVQKACGFPLCCAHPCRGCASAIWNARRSLAKRGSRCRKGKKPFRTGRRGDRQSRLRSLTQLHFMKNSGCKLFHNRVSEWLRPGGAPEISRGQGRPPWRTTAAPGSQRPSKCAPEGRRKAAWLPGSSRPCRGARDGGPWSGGVLRLKPELPPANFRRPFRASGRL